MSHVVFVMAHKIFIFPMGNIISIHINWIVVVNNTSHDLGNTIINLCTTIDNYMPRIPYALVGKKLSIEKGPKCISLTI
jgi:hypothetical protein